MSYTEISQINAPRLVQGRVPANATNCVFAACRTWGQSVLYLCRELDAVNLVGCRRTGGL